MKRIHTAGLAIIALLALSGLAASLASATEPTLLLPAPTATNPVTFTATSGEGAFESKGGVSVKCKKDTATGEATSLNLGLFHILFSECTGLLGSKCTGLGDNTGEILSLGTFHYWLYLLHEILGAAFVYLINPTHFECGGVLSLVEGCAAGPVTPLESLTTSLTNTLKQTKGVNEVTKVLPQESTKEIECILLTKSDAGTGTQSGEETTELISGFKQGGAAVTLLLNN